MTPTTFPTELDPTELDPTELDPTELGPTDPGTTVSSSDRAERSSVSTARRERTRTKLFGVAIGFGMALGVAGAALLGAGAYTHDMVRDQLVSQQITFPPANSPGMEADKYPGLQQYAGQLIDDGPKAKAWADQFMTPHILELSAGVPYGVYSAQAFRNPQDQQMAATSKLMAIGEVQRGLLLSAWGWWTVGTITRSIGLALAILGSLGLVLGAVIRIRAPRHVAAVAPT